MSTKSLDEFRDRLKGPEAAYEKIKMMRMRERVLMDALLKIRNRRDTMTRDELERIFQDTLNTLADEGKLVETYDRT